MQYNTTQYNTIQYNPMQYNAMQCNAIQYNTIQYTIAVRIKISVFYLQIWALNIMKTHTKLYQH